MSDIAKKSENALIKSLEGKPLDPILLGVANEYLKGTTISDIAEQFSTSGDVIVSVLEKKDVKSYVEGVYMTQGYMDRFRKLEIINKVIEEKLKEAMETGTHSKKDLFDWVKLASQMESDMRPKQQPGLAVQINNNTNYDQLMMDLVTINKESD